MDPDLHTKPMFAAQVAVIKKSALACLHAVAHHCDECTCRGCDAAKDAVVTLRLIATIEQGVQP